MGASFSGAWSSGNLTTISAYLWGPVRVCRAFFCSWNDKADLSIPKSSIQRTIWNRINLFCTDADLSRNSETVIMKWGLILLNFVLNISDRKLLLATATFFWWQVFRRRKSEQTFCPNLRLREFHQNQQVWKESYNVTVWCPILFNGVIATY